MADFDLALIAIFVLLIPLFLSLVILGKTGEPGKEFDIKKYLEKSPAIGLVSAEGRPEVSVGYTFTPTGSPPMYGETIEYDIEIGNLQLKSKGEMDVVFTLEFRGRELLLPCYHGSRPSPAFGYQEAVCRLTGDDTVSFAARFSGEYDDIMPIVNVSDRQQANISFSSRTDTGKFIVGNYMFTLIKRAWLIRPATENFKLIIECRDRSGLRSELRGIEWGKTEETSLCGGYARVGMSRTTAGIGRYVVSIEAHGGREWHGTGEKMELRIWLYNETFSCGGVELTQVTAGGTAFDLFGALLDKDCGNRLIQSIELGAALVPPPQGNYPLPPSVIHP